ncbi:MAG: CsgG/HfaB family protein [Treponema sp.]|nr:CsgG/HfaB family protein [Treponema sp.]
MKKIFCLAALILGVTFAYAQTLDEAVIEAANGISGRLPPQSSIVVISFESESEGLTNYVIDELNGVIANIGKIKPVERRQLNVIREELNLNLQGEISEASAQNIGRILGARYLVLGSIVTIGNQYRIRFRIITTETASIEWAYTKNIIPDVVLDSFLPGAGTRSDTRPDPSDPIGEPQKTERIVPRNAISGFLGYVPPVGINIGINYEYSFNNRFSVLGSTTFIRTEWEWALIVGAHGRWYPFKGTFFTNLGFGFSAGGLQYYDDDERTHKEDSFSSFVISPGLGWRFITKKGVKIEPLIICDIPTEIGFPLFSFGLGIGGTF